MKKLYLIKIVDSGQGLSYWLESDEYTFLAGKFNSAFLEVLKEVLQYTETNI